MIPEKLLEILARVETGETTADDAEVLRQGLTAAALVNNATWMDAVAYFRALALLQAWFIRLGKA